MQRDLVERAMAGDHGAFSELARASIGRFYAAAWRDLCALRDPDRFDAWLHRGPSPRDDAGIAQGSVSQRWGLDRNRSRPHSSQNPSHSARGAPSQRSSAASVWRIWTPSSAVRSRARSR